MSTKEGRISLVAIFTGLTIIAVPFSIVAIGGTGILMFVGIPLIALSLLRAKNGFDLSKSNNSVFWILSFLLLDAVSYLWSPASATVFFRTTLVTVFIIINKYSEKERKLLLFMACLPTIINFFNIFSGYYVTLTDSERVSVIINGVETDPNYISFCFFPAMAIISDILINKRKRKIVSIFLVTIILMVFYCELMMGCRAAFLSCFVIIFCTFISKKNFKLRSIFPFVLVLVAIYFFIPLILQILPDSVAQRFSYDMLFGSQDKMSGREDIWKSTITFIFNNMGNFILGYGAGSTNYVFSYATHNFFLQIIIELGVIGLILFIGFIISFIRFLWKTNNRISFSLFIGTVFMSLSLSVNSILAFWINIAMAFVFISVDRID